MRAKHLVVLPLKYSLNSLLFLFLLNLSFTWGSFDSGTLINSLNAAYDEVVHWKPNFFKDPYGNTGKSFVSELGRLYKAFATGSTMESIAKKAAIVLPILLLQKSSCNSKVMGIVAV